MKLKANAYAKLNLYLGVLNKRDDGYHNIDSVMQTISLHNTIEISVNDTNEVSITYQDPSLWREDDILFKTCEEFFKFSGWKKGLSISINHRIPTVAGLGGFSANIACLLHLLNRISGKNYSDDKMLPLCLKLGADVPFCYVGGTARVQNIGDKIDELPTVNFNLVLIKEGEKKSTGTMYNILDQLSLSASKKIDSIILGLYEGDARKVVSSTYNAFENCYNMEEMKKLFNPFSPDAVFLSGSGPTVVSAFISRERAENCYNTLKKEGRNVFLAECVGKTIE